MRAVPVEPTGYPVPHANGAAGIIEAATSGAQDASAYRNPASKALNRAAARVSCGRGR